MQTILRLLARFICLVISSALLSGALYAQTSPVMVDKVDPPNWRMGSSDLVLHLSGRNLDSVRGVAIKHKGVHVMRIEALDANHLLVWLRLSPDAMPGNMVLQISTPYMITFAVVPMFEQNVNPSLASRGELTADK